MHWPEGIEAEETVWRDYYTGEQLEDWAKPWYGGEGDVRKGEGDNCLWYYTDTPTEESWGEQGCKSDAWGCACMYQRLPILTLRGICPGSALAPQDSPDYVPKQLPSSPSNLFLVGAISTQIRYNDTTEQWILTDAVSSVTAVSKASKLSFVLGKHTWTVTNDVFGCSEGRPYTIQLKLTGCSEGQFTCSDGQCINIAKRCDQTPNCRDESDEKGCKLIELKESYNKLIPPISTVSPANDTILPAHVNVSIVLLKIVSMEEVEHSIDFQFEVVLSWRENRVSYNNLKQKTALNALTKEGISMLWLPYMIYDNTDMKEAVQLADDLKTTVVISREGSFTRSNTDHVDESEIFRGGENALTMQQTYTKSFQCQYQLHRYPFDTQVNCQHQNCSTQPSPASLMANWGCGHAVLSLIFGSIVSFSSSCCP
jgi:hypothetical protein